MIYDPELTAADPQGRRCNLALDSALAHPDVPMLLAWPPAAEPRAETLRMLHAGAGHVRLARRDPTALVEQVRALVGSPLIQVSP